MNTTPRWSFTEAHVSFHISCPASVPFCTDDHNGIPSGVGSDFRTGEGNLGQKKHTPPKPSIPRVLLLQKICGFTLLVQTDGKLEGVLEVSRRCPIAPLTGIG